MWEVFIGAAVALVSGFGGAWLQAQSSKQLLATQLADAENAREEAYAREDHTRFAEQKRAAYASLMSNWSNLDYRRAEADEAVAAAAELPEPDPLDGGALSQARDLHAEAARLSEEVHRMLEAVIAAMETVLLLAPSEVRDALPESSAPEAARSAFLKAARLDLGIPD